MSIRIEFKTKRTSCSCPDCVENCKHMPGFLVPSDLGRLIPSDVRGLALYDWAEKNLLASPGALVRNTAERRNFRIPTLVPAVKADGSCIHLTAENLCSIHENAPFGCAFFDCRPTGPRDRELASKGIREVQTHQQPGFLYGMLWRHLWAMGKRQKAPEELRPEMRMLG